MATDKALHEVLLENGLINIRRTYMSKSLANPSVDPFR